MKRFVDFWELFLPGTGVIFTLFDDAGEAQGAIGGLIYPDVYSGVPVATEFFWFIRPGTGGGPGLYYQFGSGPARRCSKSDGLPVQRHAEGMGVLFDELGFGPSSPLLERLVR